MDAHFFRILAAELASLLDGARLEKIYGPLPDVFTFTLFAAGQKRRLLFRHERKRPFLFFDDYGLPNPPRPPAAVMRLRKYCANRRLGRAVIDFSRRRLAFPVACAPDEQTLWLMLDMVSGAFVESALPSDFFQPPAWPDGPLVDSLCGTPWKKGESDGPWREFNVLTPLLRETLSALSPPEGRALLVDLEAGGGLPFLYANLAGSPAFCTAWPLPEALLSRRCLKPLSLPLDEEEAVAFTPWLGGVAAFLPAFPALACTALVDAPALRNEVAAASHKEKTAPIRRAAKKQEKLLDKLDREAERLKAMVALRVDAGYLQGILWQYGPEEKRAEIAIEEGPEAGRVIRLEPRLSVRENMTEMFRQAARGARGLAMLETRRAALAASIGRKPEEGGDERGGAFTVSSISRTLRETSEEAPPDIQTKDRPGTLRPAPHGYKDYPGVASFISSDGFLLLRGKNAQGNHRLLKIGSGHDFWLHAQAGPSAHLIIRRAHAAEEIPESTVLEAARLVAEKSHFRDDDKAEVMMALLRHVHPIRGEKPGTVRVDTVARTVRVALRENGEAPAGRDD